MTVLVIIAKEPIAGRVKTRLHPPLSLEQAAELAAACIDDTIAATRVLPATRRLLYFDGVNAPASASGFEILPQSSGDLDERLAFLFDVLDEPAILIGMDTPQVTASDLAPAFGVWETDVLFGAAVDGGFWALGMREPRGDLIRGVPMSRDDTGAIQLQRLADAGLTVAHLPTLTDVDTITEARNVAAGAPETTFAMRLSSFEQAAASAQ